MAKVRIWTARLHDKEEMHNLQAQVETELAQVTPRQRATVTWLQTGAGDGNRCEFNLTAIVEVR